MATVKEKTAVQEVVNIPEPKFGIAKFLLTGNAPYVSNKFAAEAREMMRAKMAAGGQAKKGGPRAPKNFERNFIESMHAFPAGSFDSKSTVYGVPASCFRQAMISACRIVEFKMTLAKLCLFVVPDGFDADDASPLVRFTKGTPLPFEACTRNETGVADIRVRGRWEPGWEIELKVRFDAVRFRDSDVLNLLRRVGLQVGIGAGRPDSKTSAGCGWGTFSVSQIGEAEIEGGEPAKESTKAA